MLLPIAITAFLAYTYDSRLLTIFIASMLVGLVCEWLFGYYYEHIVGQKLWTYKKYNINGYTSWLALPLWGFAGVLFAFMTKLMLG